MPSMRKSRSNKKENNNPISILYICPVCGRYEFSETEYMNPSLDKKRLSLYLCYKRFCIGRDKATEYRYHTTMAKEKCDEFAEEFQKGNIRHGLPVHMDNDIIGAWYPRTFTDKVDMIMLKLNELADYIGQEIIRLTGGRGPFVNI